MDQKMKGQSMKSRSMNPQCHEVNLVTARLYRLNTLSFWKGVNWLKFPSTYANPFQFQSIKLTSVFSGDKK